MPPPADLAGEQSPPTQTAASLRRAVTLAATLNLAFFGAEFTMARRIGSVSLFADSIDFLEDTAVNALVLLALGYSIGTRARIGVLLALLLLVPGVATLWTAWHKLLEPLAPAPLPLSLTALAALLVNVGCALLLSPVRSAGGSLSRAAYLSARNDAWAGLAILGAAALTAAWPSAWPDLAVGLAIFGLSLGAARQVYRQARAEAQLAR
ncbi:MAG: cation transporter [Steroidobacteraceae bacterium]